MDKELACRLEEMNRRFYELNADSFSSTRRGPWPGWGRCLDAASGMLPASGARMIDIACGNMRFERYLAESGRIPGSRVLAVDSCVEFAEQEGLNRCAAGGVDVSFARCDVLEALRGEGLAALFGEGVHNLVACFGFFHHVPGADTRAQLAGELCRLAAPGGLVVVSLWRFASDPGLREQAERTTEEACAALGLAGLEAGDYILGWDGRPGTYRYCHSFSDEDVHVLEDSLPKGVRTVASFLSDGRTGALNAYLVLRHDS